MILNARLLATALFVQAISLVLSAPRLYGVNYGLRTGPDWAPFEERCKDYGQVVSELTQLQTVTNNVRIYSLTDCDDAYVMLRATKEVGMGLWLGIWVGPKSSVFADEREKLLWLITQYDFSNVLGIHVSSEAVYRDDISSQEAIRLRNIIKSDMMDSGNSHLASIPITIADIEGSFAADTDLIKADDLAVTLNMFGFWEPCCTDINGGPDYPSAAEFFDERMAYAESLAGSRQMIISETGWADGGSNKNANNASPSAMAKWMRDFVCLANAKGWQYFWFNAYDESWRRVQSDREDDVEGHFGIFYESGEIKPYMEELQIDCSDGYTNVNPNEEPASKTPAPANPPTLPPVISVAPIPEPSEAPIPKPSEAPSTTLSQAPSKSLSQSPTTIPSQDPTQSPSPGPTPSPTSAPTTTPSSTPTTKMSSQSPTATPTQPPTTSPSRTVPTSTTTSALEKDLQEVSSSGAVGGARTSTSSLGLLLAFATTIVAMRGP